MVARVDFAPDADPITSEALVPAMGRLAVESEAAYVLLETFAPIPSPPHTAEGFRVALAVAPDGIELPASLWVQELDAALRAVESDGIRLPAPEFARHLSGSGTSPDRQALSWLTAVRDLNGGRVLLMIDGIERWPQSAAYWPPLLPTGLCVVLAGRLSRLAPPLRQRMATLVDAGAPQLRLDGADDDAEPLPARGRDKNPEAFRDACRMQASWAQEKLLDASCPVAALSVARDGLWRWVIDSQDGRLAVRLAQSEPLTHRMRQLLESQPLLAALRVASDWHEALIMRDAALLPPGAVPEVALLRADLLRRAGAWNEAWHGAGEVVHQLTALLRDGDAAARPLLAHALVARARAAVRIEMAAAAVEDCTRAVELYEMERIHRGASFAEVPLAQARWTMGLAMAAVGQPEAGAAQIEPAADVLSQEAPDAAAGLYLDLASLHLRRGRFDVAESWCERALAHLGDKDPAARAAGRARLARIRTARGKVAEAVADLRGALAVWQPLLDGGRLDLLAATAQAHYDLATLLSGSGLTREAFEQLGEAIRLFDRAVEEQGAADCRPALARACNDQGLLAARLGDDGHAVQACSRAIAIGTVLLERERRSALRGDLARAYNNRARALARRGEAEPALRDYEQAAHHYGILVTRQHRLEFRHHLALVHHNRGGVCRGRHDHAAAIEAYGRAVELLGHLRLEHETTAITRDLAAALANRALAHAARSDGDAALADASQAIALFGRLRPDGGPEMGRDLAAALLSRARIHARALRFEEAVADSTAALDAAGHDNDIHHAAVMERGRAQLALRRFEAADNDFAAAVTLCQVRPEAPSAALAEAWTLRGRALHGCRALQEARLALDSAVGLCRVREARGEICHAEYAAALHARGLLRLETDGAEAAREDLEAALECSEGLPGHERLAIRLRTDRSQMYFQLGQFTRAWVEARDAVDRVCRLEPPAPEAERLLAEGLAARGDAAQALRRGDEALHDYTRSIAAYSRLAEDARDVEVCAALARVYAHRAAAHRLAGSQQNATFDYGWAVDLFRELVERFGLSHLEDELADACAARGCILYDAGRPREALADLETAMALGRRTDADSGRELPETMRACEASLEESKPC